MPTLIGFHITSEQQLATDHTNIAPLDVLGGVLYEERRASNIETTLSSSVSESLPIQPSHPRTIAGFSTVGFTEDWYNRVHILPPTVALGNMLTSEEREVAVWNAHFSDKVLSAVTVNNNDALAFSAGATQETFTPLEYKVYTLSVSMTGQPVIDTTYTLSFPSESPTLRVLGFRTIIWGFMPQESFTEDLEWKTDVIQSFTSEQRLALRAAPRQTIRYKHLLDRSEFAMAKAMATGWAYRVYAVPVWREFTRVGAVQATDLEINVDTSNADWRVGEGVIVWGSNSEFVSAEITAVHATKLTIKQELAIDLPYAYVAPLRFARTYDGVSFSRGPNEVIDAAVSFVTVARDVNLEANPFPLFLGKPVVTDRSIVVGSFDERVAYELDVFDNGSGLVEVDVQRQRPVVRHTLSSETISRQGLWRLRQWLHYLKGRQKTFWLPTWNPDLVLADPATTGSTGIVVYSAGYTRYYVSPKSIMVQLKSGTKLYNEITSAVDYGNGTEGLSLLNALTATFAPEDVDFICFMHCVRLDTDKITFTHSAYERSSFSASVVEVPK